MKPVDQTVFAPGKGNCFSACVASILEVGTDEVPFFMVDAAWKDLFLDWCGERRLVVDFSSGFPAPLGEFYIANGISPRGDTRGHSVVMRDGHVVHDPHPDRTGLAGKPWGWITLRTGA